jgi:hypothetical protein
MAHSWISAVVDADHRLVALRPLWLWAWGREAALDLEAASPVPQRPEEWVTVALHLAWHRGQNGLRMPLRSWAEVYGVPDWAWEEG